MITKHHIISAPPWTLFKGPAADPGAVAWLLSELDPDCPDDVFARMGLLGVARDNPQRDDSAQGDDSGFDDIDAALAYLRAGGAVCKVPAVSGRERLLVVPDVLAIPAFPDGLGPATT